MKLILTAAEKFWYVLGCLALGAGGRSPSSDSLSDGRHTLSPTNRPVAGVGMTLMGASEACLVQ